MPSDRDNITKAERGGETVQELKTRLKTEGLWSRYLTERDALYQSGVTKKDAIKILVRRFGKDCTEEDRKDFLVVDGIEIRKRGDYELGIAARGGKSVVENYVEKIAEKETPKPKVTRQAPQVNVNARPKTKAEKYSERLPNGCPLFDPKDFKGETDYYHDVMWTEQNVSRIDIDESNLAKVAPSLSCAAYFWSVRYTADGMEAHRLAMQKLTIADKSNLKRNNLRDDDGGMLEIIDRVLDRVDKMINDKGD